MVNKTDVTFLAKPVNHLYMLLVSAGSLTFLGLVMVFSASSIHAIDTKGTALAVVLRQLLFVAISIPLAMYLSKLPVARWEIAGRFGMLISIALLTVILIPGVGKTVNGNTNWIDLKIIDVQPSEISKFFMILWASFLLARKEKSGRFNFNVFSLIGPGFLVIIVLVMAGMTLVHHQY